MGNTNGAHKAPHHRRWNAKVDKTFVTSDGGTATIENLDRTPAGEMSTKRKPGPFDCYGKALPDEPMFVLLARDPYAAVLVQRWIDWAVLNSKDPRQIAAARQTKRLMEDWRADHDPEEWRNPSRRFTRRGDD